MDKEQLTIVKEHLAHGGGQDYTWSELPGAALNQQPKATFYKLIDGELRTFPNLPADPYSLRRYLARGFSPVKPAKAEKVETAVEEVPPPAPTHKKRKVRRIKK